MNLASELAQASVSARCRKDLQAGTHGLGDPSTAGLLRLFEKRHRYLYSDFPRCFHGLYCTVFKASIEYGLTESEKTDPKVLRGGQLRLAALYYGNRQKPTF